MLDIVSTSSVLPSRKLNMKTKRELRKANAINARSRVVKCRFALPVVFALVVREHTKNKTAHIQKQT